MRLVGFRNIAGGGRGRTVVVNPVMFGKIQGILHFLVDLVARHGIGIGDEDGGDMRLHSQCLAEGLRGDSGFGDFISIESEH
jgi:hypothetical protein